MFSPYRIPPSNAHTRKQKTSNHTEHDLKMTSIDLKEVSKNPIKNRKNEIKGGDPNDDNATQGSSLIEQAFFLIKWLSLWIF